MAVQINQFNVNSGTVNKHKGLMYNSSVWHKLQIGNAQDVERDFLLKTLMNAVHPLDFIPVSYETSGQFTTFLLKNCGAALENLCRNNLVVPNPNNVNNPFKLTVFLNFAKASDLKINVQNNVINVLHKRFNADSGVLNLEQFYKDPDLNEFCPLSQPKLMFYILHLSKGYNIKQLRLASNDIEVLKPFEAVYCLKSVTCIDLRNNNISDISEIRYLKDLHITELWLDGNPICDEYDEFTYGKSMREMLDKLEKLDGLSVVPKGFLSFRRNFLCNSSGQDLVDQFLEHYFTLYDSQNRFALDGIYHKLAMLSLTSTYLTLQSTSLTAKLIPYKKISRNIKHISDFSKNNEFLFRGPQAILRTLNSLPRSEHDPYTFTVDLMTYTETTAIIVVTGVFREPAEYLLESDRLLGFTRTFVLLAGQNGECTIVNEQFHITNATTTQAARAFKITRIPRPRHIQIPAPQNLNEQNELIETMRIITGLNMEWAKNCLEDSHYDLKKALVTFVDLYKVDKIPQTAFMSVNEELQQKQEQQPTLQFELQRIQEMIQLKSLRNVHEHINIKNENSSLKKSLQAVASIEASNSTVLETQQLCNTVNNRKRNDEVGDLFELSYINDEGTSKVKSKSRGKDEEVILIQSDSEEASALPTELQTTNLKKPLQGKKPPMTAKRMQILAKEIRNRVNAFKLRIRLNDHNAARVLAEAIIKDYGDQVLQPWHHILQTYYKVDLSLGRHYAEVGYKRLSSGNLRGEFEKLHARMEILHGDRKQGEEMYKSLVRRQPHSVGIAVAYARFLLENNRVVDAKAVFDDLITLNPNNIEKHEKQVKWLQKEFRCKLLD